MATFLLVHGAWHDASCWDGVRMALADRGHAVVAPDLPCDDPGATFADYAAAAADAARAAEGPVVAVGHSLAGCTIPLLPPLLPVAVLVFLCAALPPIGPEGAPTQIEPAFSRSFGSDEAGRGVWEPDRAIEIMYAGLPHPVAVAAAATLRPQSWTPNRVPYPITRLPDVPCTSVVAERDHVVSVPYSLWAAREILGLEPIVIAGGHFPMLEDPSGLAELLCRLLEEPA